MIAASKDALAHGNFLLPLTRGYVAIIDRADLDKQWSCQFRDGHWWRGYIADMSWCSLLRKYTTYARSSAFVANRHREILLHRILLNATTGLVGDHIDGNGLDNRQSNIRLVTYSQNSLHRVHGGPYVYGGPYAYTGNGGVAVRRRRRKVNDYLKCGDIKSWFATREQRFYAHAFDGTKWRFAGYAKTKEAVEQMAAEFARLNFPQGGVS